jgi:hypothetical protein
VLLSACSLISPYTITFTTQDGAVVDPATDTLDFVVNVPALAYISEVDCDGADDLEILPVLTDDMESAAAHNLALTMLNGAPGSECEVTVTAFDETTTSNARESIDLVIAGGEEEEVEEVEEEMPAEESTESTDTDGAIMIEVEATGETSGTEVTPAE